MSFIELYGFFTCYGFPSLIISVIVAAIMIVCDILFKEKISAAVKTYLPFVAGAMIYFIYDAIFVSRGVLITEDKLYAGLICGSAACGIFALYKKIKSGKIPAVSSGAALVIEGVIGDYVEPSSLSATAEVIDGILKDALTAEDCDEKDLTEKVFEILSANEKNEFRKDELLSVAALVVRTMKVFYLPDNR